MKRFLVFVVMLTLPVFFTAAQDDGLGLTVGVELECPGINDEFALNVIPFLEYDTSFGDLDIWAWLGVSFGVVHDEDDFPVNLSAEFLPWYNLRLSSDSTLSIGVYGNLEYQISPSVDDALFFELEPRVKYNQSFDFGDLYGIIGLPVGLVYPYDDYDVSLGVKFTLGWASTFGLELELTPHFMFMPDGVDMYEGIELLISYEADSIYGELVVGIPNDMDYGGYHFDPGVTLSPHVEYRFARMAVYLGADIIGIGSSSDIEVDLKAGFKYSF